MEESLDLYFIGFLSLESRSAIVLRSIWGASEQKSQPGVERRKAQFSQG